MENKDWREEFEKIEVHYHTALGRPNAFSEPLMIDDEQEKAIISFIDSLLKSKQEEIEKVMEKKMLPETEMKGGVDYMCGRAYNQAVDDLKPIITNILK